MDQASGNNQVRPEKGLLLILPAWAKSAGGPFVWGLLGLIACLAVAGLEPNLVEEGLVVHVAQRLVSGEHMYRDITFFSGPLPFDLLALLFRIFGEEVAVGRYAIAALHGLATGLTYAFTRQSGAGAFAHAATGAIAAVPVILFPFFSMFWYTTLAYHLSLISIYVTLRGTRSIRWAITAGVLVSCVALCKQTLGAVLAFGLLVALTAGSPPGQRLAHARAMMLAGAATALATVSLFALRGDLAELVRCLVVIPLSLGETYGTPYINLWPPGVLDPEILSNKVLYVPNLFFLAYGIFTQVGPKMILFTQLLYALPLAALLATAIRRLTGPLPAGVLLNTALLLAMSANLFPRSDWGHLVFAIPSAVVQIVLLSSTSHAAQGPARRASFIFAVGLVLVVASATLWVGRTLSGLAVTSYWGPRIPQRPVSQIYRTVSIPRVISYLRVKTKPKEPIFVARSEPLLYFATDTTNPTPFTGVLPVLHDEQERAILAALPELRYVVMSDIDQPAYTYYSDELPRVQAHLERFFRVPRDFPLDDASWIILLERGRDRGPTAIDLVRASASAETWVRDIHGIQHTVTEPPPRMAARQNRRPLAVRLGPFGGGIDFQVSLPPNAVFQAGVGFRGMVSVTDFYIHPAGATLVLSIGREGHFRKLRSVRIDDSEQAGRRWKPFEIGLSAYAGQSVTLRLEAVPDSFFRPDTFTWWGSPRIALPPS